jgi:hypothetical protein
MVRGEFKDLWAGLHDRSHDDVLRWLRVRDLLTAKAPVETEEDLREIFDAVSAFSIFEHEPAATEEERHKAGWHGYDGLQDFLRWMGRVNLVALRWLTVERDRDLSPAFSQCDAKDAEVLALMEA